MVAPSKRRTSTTRVRISKSGQITLPAEVRRSLDVTAGDYVDIVQGTDGHVRVVSTNPLTIEEFAGSLGPPPGGTSLTDYIDDVDRSPMVRSIYEEPETFE